MVDNPLDFSSFEEAALQRPRSTLNIRFEKVLTVNPAKTAEAGYPKHDEKHIAYIRVPGSRDETPVAINDKFLSEHGPAYERWKATQEQPLDGLALEMWPPIPKSLIEDWKYFGVRTVQQLSSLSDTQIQKLGMGAREWQKKAKLWLDEAVSHAESQRLHSELQTAKGEVAMLKQQVADLAAKASAMPAQASPAIDMAALAAEVARQMKNGAAK